MIQKDIQQTLLTAQLTPSSAYQTKKISNYNRF